MRAMLLGMDEGFSRISLSTADLERQPGDMLFDRVRGCQLPAWCLVCTIIASPLLCSCCPPWGSEMVIDGQKQSA